MNRGVLATWRAMAALALACALVVSVSVSVVPASAQQVTPAETLAGTRLLQALREGGFVLYFRHASTDFGQNDERMTGYEDCSLQRNLTDQGRAEARAIGRAIEALHVPIGEVLASPFCRTMETARLAFGRATATEAARGGPASDEGDRYRGLRRLLSTPVAPGSNRVITSHGNPYRAVVGSAYLQEGEAAVIRPLGERGFAIVARIRKDDWTSLAGS